MCAHVCVWEYSVGSTCEYMSAEDTCDFMSVEGTC